MSRAGRPVVVEPRLGLYHGILCQLASVDVVVIDAGRGTLWHRAAGPYLTNYRKALEITPTQADILNNLGFAQAAKKQYAEAIMNFEAALKNDPDSASTHNNLATVLFIQKRFDEAVRHFREALRITPGNPQIYSNLGDALVKQGQTAEAVRCYQEALRLKPGDPQIKTKLQALGAPTSNYNSYCAVTTKRSNQIKNILPQTKRDIIAQFGNPQQSPRIFRLRNNFEQGGLRLPPGVAGGFDGII